MLFVCDPGSSQDIAEPSCAGSLTGSYSLPYALNNNVRLHGCLSLLQTTNTTNADIQLVAGFNPYECHGAVLLWNNGTLDIALTAKILAIPYSHFSVDVIQLDPAHMPGVSGASFCAADCPA